MDKKRQQQIGAVHIPASIMCQTDLTLTQKVIWGRIEGLSVKGGYCYASNQWIGEQISLSKSTVSNNISILVKKGYVKNIIIRNDKNEITERRLYPLSTEKLIPSTEKSDTPITVKSEESVTDSSVTEETSLLEEDKKQSSSKSTFSDFTAHQNHAEKEIAFPNLTINDLTNYLEKTTTDFVEQ